MTTPNTPATPSAPADTTVTEPSNAQPEGGIPAPAAAAAATSPAAIEPVAAGGQPADDDRASRAIAAVREDFKAERAKRQATEKQLADLQASLTAREEADKQRNLALAKAFGFAPDEPPDPEKLAADLRAAQDRAQADAAAHTTRERELQVELATLRQAAKHGADPARLADSRTFMAAAAALDPASETFADDLGAAIAKAVEANPALKAAGPAPVADPAPAPGSPEPVSATTAPPARSGGEHNGAPGGNRQWTDQDVARATPAEVDEAMRAGLLTDLGFAAPKKTRR